MGREKVEKSRKGQIGPGRYPKAEDPIIKDRARLVVYYYRLEGLPLYQAWKKANPGTKASKKNSSQLARRDVDWYMAEFGQDVKEMLRVHGFTEEYLGRRTFELAEHKVEKVVTETKKIRVKGVGGYTERHIDIKRLKEYDEFTTQLRALELGADLLGARQKEEKGSDLPAMIIVKVPIIKKKPGGFD